METKKSFRIKDKDISISIMVNKKSKHSLIEIDSEYNQHFIFSENDNEAAIHFSKIGYHELMEILNSKVDLSLTGSLYSAKLSKN